MKNSAQGLEACLPACRWQVRSQKSPAGEANVNKLAIRQAKLVTVRLSDKMIIWNFIPTQYL